MQRIGLHPPKLSMISNREKTELWNMRERTFGRSRRRRCIKVSPVPLASQEREAVLAALNGLMGDYLAATGNPLAIPMRLRRNGQALTLKRKAPVVLGSAATRQATCVSAWPVHERSATCIQVLPRDIVYSCGCPLYPLPWSNHKT